MTIDTFFQGDTVEITSDTDFDNLSTASTIEFLITKPSGEVAKWTATQVRTTQDITYTTVAADLDELGTYKIQSHVEWASSSELHGEIKKFKVIAHLSEEVSP
jgi:hypothetical protein